MFHAALLSIREAAAASQRRKHPTMPIRPKKQRTRILQQNPLELLIHSPHRSLAKNPAILRRQSKPMMLLEISPCYLVRRRARHHIQRNRDVIPPPDRQHLLQNDLEQRSIGQRSDLKQPLRLVEPQSRSQTPGYKNHPNLARSQQLCPHGPRGVRCESHSLAIQPHGRRWLGSCRQRCPFRFRVAACSFRPRKFSFQLAKQLRIDATDLLSEPHSLVRAKPIPKREQMLLPNRCQLLQQLASHLLRFIRTHKLDSSRSEQPSLDEQICQPAQDRKQN